MYSTAIARLEHHAAPLAPTLTITCSLACHCYGRFSCHAAWLHQRVSHLAFDLALGRSQHYPDALKYKRMLLTSDSYTLVTASLCRWHAGATNLDTGPPPLSCVYSACCMQARSCACMQPTSQAGVSLCFGDRTGDGLGLTRGSSEVADTCSRLGGTLVPRATPGGASIVSSATSHVSHPVPWG